MPFVLITIGVILIVTAMNGTSGKFGTQLGSDLFGSGSGNGFIYWVAAIVIMGFVGYIPKMQKFADAMIVLILVAMILNRNGFFSEFTQALQSTSSAAATSAASQPATAIPITGTGTSLNPFSGVSTSTSTPSYTSIPITGTGSILSNPLETGGGLQSSDPLGWSVTPGGNSETPGEITLPTFNITE